MKPTPPSVAYSSVPRMWPNADVVCIGSGPSLMQADVDYCRGLARIIAVSDAIRLAPFADVLYSCDWAWWKVHQGVMSFTGPKYALTQPRRHDWGIRVLRQDRPVRKDGSLGCGRMGLCLAPDGLRTGSNSGYQAVNLAVHFGARRIILLGYDMQRGPTGGHFFGEHQTGLNRGSPYRMFREAFETLVEPLKTLHIEIVNCSRVTALTCFPRMPLDQALPHAQLAEAV